MATADVLSVKTFVRKNYRATAAEETGFLTKFLSRDPGPGIREQGWSPSGH